MARLALVLYVCVPLAVASLLLLQRYLHLTTTRRTVRLDGAGALLIAAAASLPMIWVSFAGTSFPWWGWETAAMLGGTAVLASVLVLVETRVSEPLLPLRVVRTRTTALSIVASIGVGIAIFGAPAFLGQYFQVVRGYTPTEAGLLSIPLMVGSLVGTAGSGQIITRTGRGAGSAAVALVAVLFLREIALRRTVGLAPAAEPVAPAGVGEPDHAAAGPGRGRHRP